jgi:2,3-dihydroxy-2,3-dihydro-p-cumate dehydrogenase
VAEARVFRSAPFEVKTQCRRYEGRVAIVTGGAQGLARVIARRLAEEGADVVIADIQEERGQRTAKELEEQTGQRFMWIGGDLSVPGIADEVVTQTLARFGRIDNLVNSAAFQARLKLVDFTEDLMQKSVDWNIWNTVRICKAVVPHMIERKYGRIVNIGGEAFRTGSPFHTFLGGIGKGGIVGLTACLAGELVADGITVNCVSPGAMETQADGTPDSTAGGRDPAINDPEFLAPRAGGGGGRGIGRPAHPTEVAAAVAFFGAPEASFITGQTLSVNAGTVMN